MKYIQNNSRLASLLKSEGIPALFETEELDFRLIQYEKGELICSPRQPLDQMLFVVKGIVHVYCLREDGSKIFIPCVVDRTVLGTTEFAYNKLSFYAEASEKIICIALQLEENRVTLEQERVFMRFVITHLAGMLHTISLIGHEEQPVEERVLTFLRDIQQDHTLHSINSGIMQFHCSRRHLQRVVQKLCQEGKLEKEKKGRYRLTAYKRSELI